MSVSIGIDWSATKHDVCVVNEAGTGVAALVLPHTAPWAAKPIFVQFAIIFGVYAHLATLHTHMTFARFAQGLAALHR